MRKRQSRLQAAWRDPVGSKLIADVIKKGVYLVAGIVIALGGITWGKKMHIPRESCH